MSGARLHDRTMCVVVAPEIVLDMACRSAAIAAPHRLLAPTLLRSQVLAPLNTAVRQGEPDRPGAERQLDQSCALRIRFLNDRVLQRVAGQIAERQGWPDTYTAEYVALTRLQADTFVTRDPAVVREVAGLVALGTIEDLGEDLVDSSCSPEPGGPP